MKKFVAYLLLTCAFGCSQPPAKPPLFPTAKSLFTALEQSSVAIYTEDAKAVYAGSGTVIHRSKEGVVLILTCAHLFSEIKGSVTAPHSKNPIVVAVYGEGQVALETVPAMIVSIDTDRDLALLVTIGPLNRQPRPISKRNPDRFDTVFLMADPNDIPNFPVRGYLANSHFGKDGSYYLLSAFAFLGSSGGMVTNANGELIGVIVAIGVAHTEHEIIIPEMVRVVPLPVIKNFLKDWVK